MTSRFTQPIYFEYKRSETTLVKLSIYDNFKDYEKYTKPNFYTQVEEHEQRPAERTLDELVRNGNGSVDLGLGDTLLCEHTLDLSAFVSAIENGDFHIEELFFKKNDT